MLKLCGPKGWPLTLDEILSRPHQLIDIGKTTEGGHEVVNVKFSLELLPGESGEFAVRIDPGANYLASKLVGSRAGSVDGEGIARESQVLSFTEPVIGVFFPEVVETKYYSEGKVSETIRATFSEIRINERLPANTFELAIPRGAQVIDSIRDKVYIAGSDGEPVAGTQQLAKYPPLAATGEIQAETAIEPRSLTQWILPISVVLAVGTGIFWCVQQFRRSRGAA
jgi:hypothetical protein